MNQLPRRTSPRLKNANTLCTFVVLLALPALSSLATATEINVNPTTVNFGTIAVGTSKSATVTLTNSTNATIKVTQVAIYGTGFSLRGITTPLYLLAGESSIFSVMFNPQTGTASKGGLVINSKAPDSPQRVTLLGSGWAPVKAVVPAQFLGLALHPEVLTNRVPWPAIPFGAMRLWDTGTQWAALNPAEGSYDWPQLDSWFALAAKNGKTDLLYTLGVVPTWASSKPGDQTCVSQANPAGSCDPPYDLNPDGTGTDKLWQDYVTALVNHAAGRIKYWELWNEPDIASEWSGTTAQMVRMAKDAYTIIKAADPAALVLTPSAVNAGPSGTIKVWLPAYLAAGGGAYADMVAFHGYINPALGQAPEAIANTVDQVTSSLTGALASKPIWNTEGAWPNDSSIPNANLQAAFVARMYLVQWSKGISRFYWFQYGNSETGTFWTPMGPDAAEIAYGQVYDWLVGATIATPCSATGTVWTCSFTKPGGIQEQAVWDTSKTCNGNSCSTSSYTPAVVFNKYTDLMGNVIPISPGSTIQIGIEPILLEN